MGQTATNNKVRVIDATPTWEGMLGYYLLVLSDGNDEGKKLAKAELLNMAKTADLYNAATKSNNELLNEVDTALATLFIGADHGITPQANKACKDVAIKVQTALGFRDGSGNLIDKVN